MQSIGSKVIVRRLLFFLTFISLLGLPASIRVVEIQEIQTKDFFVIEKGQGINTIIDNLKNQNNNKFLSFLKVKFLFESKNIIPGRYEIKPGMTYIELFEDIFEGNLQQFRFTIIEGTVAKDALSKLEEIIKNNNLNFQISSKTKEIFSNESLILPDTYFFTDRNQLERLMINQQIRLNNILKRLWKEKPKENPLKNINEALVLASIVEREAAVEWEREQIASVFLSRIRDGWRLDADPTLIYGYYGDFSKKITKDNLKAVKGDNNPFNTYKVKGLPPRPICYPSLSSIEAVIMSSPGEYFFFVAKGDGTHIFSKTLDEHNIAVNNR